MEFALDLAVGRFHPPRGDAQSVCQRAREALQRMAGLLRPPPAVTVIAANARVIARNPWVKLVSGGFLYFGGMRPWWRSTSICPKIEGKPLLEGMTVSDRSQFAGGVLALATTQPGQPQKLFLFKAPNGRLLAEYVMPSPNYLFQLSPDGRRLARQVGDKAVEVVETADNRVVARFGRAAVHSNLTVQRQGNWLVLAIGKHQHGFALDAVPLRYQQREFSANSALNPNLNAVFAHAGTYDHKRFRPRKVGSLTYLCDQDGGQIILLEGDGQPAMHILIRRGLAAIVLPDGTRWGAAALLGGPETPGAGLAVGRALMAAAGGEA
jgi:hypothetical protein